MNLPVKYQMAEGSKIKKKRKQSTLTEGIRSKQSPSKKVAN